MGRIDTELHIIQNNRYGENVRMAIHDALDKLEKTSGGGGGGGIAFSAALKTRSAKGFASSVNLKAAKIPVDIDDLERGDINDNGSNTSSDYYLRFKSSTKYALPDGALSVRATVVTAASASSYTPRFGIAWYDANDNFLSITYYYSNSQWVSIPANAKKVRYTISWTTNYRIIPEQIESMLIEAN